MGTFQGFGTHFYDDVVVYEGEWSAGLRHGWGRMVYTDRSIYEGEWSEGKMSGTGMTLYGQFNNKSISFTYTKLLLFMDCCSWQQSD